MWAGLYLRNKKLRRNNNQSNKIKIDLKKSNNFGVVTVTFGNVMNC